VTREVRFLDEAVSELRDAAVWYQERSEGLGLVFLSVIDTAVDVSSRWPGSGALVDRMSDDLEVRRTTIARFPYYIAYLASDDDLVVLAVAHERREPTYWIDRAER